MENSEVSQMAYNAFNKACLLSEHTDVTIMANCTEFQVHKIILSACSPYFRALFSQRWIDQAYDIPGIPPGILSLVIEFAYTRSVLITEENVFELLVTADQLLVSGLVGACCQFLEKCLCPDTCVIIYQNTKYFYSCEKVHQKAKQYILLHFEKVLRTKEFLELSVEELEEMLDDDQLNVKREELVFEAILQWIDHKQKRRRKDIAVLLPKVRLGLMETDYFMNNVEQNALVKENEACKSMIVSAKKLKRVTVNSVDFDGELYGPISSELQQKLTRPRLPSAILLAIGGFSYGLTIEFEAFNVREEFWTRTNAVGEHHRAYLGTAVLDTFVYCIGGFNNFKCVCSVRKFNLITQTWHEVPSLHERRCYVSATVLDGLIYAIGGCDGRRELQSAEYYNPKTNQWNLTAQMSEQRCHSSATSLHGKVYICGGFNGTEYLSSAEIFDPQSNQWTLIAPMRRCRSAFGVIACRGLVYAVGGFDGHSSIQTVEAYNPLTNTWRNVASMGQTNCNFGIEVVDDQLFVVGGLDGSGRNPNAKRYDVEKDKWYTVNGMSRSRCGLSCCVVSGLQNIVHIMKYMAL